MHGHSSTAASISTVTIVLLMFLFSAAVFGAEALKPSDFVLELQSIPISINRLAELEKNQIPFDETKWNADQNARCHMIVDLLRRHKLRGKKEVAVDQVLGKPVNFYAPPNSLSYSLHYWSRCGNQPQLYLEIRYRKGRVSQYRAAYWDDGGTPIEQVTPWVN